MKHTPGPWILERKDMDIPNLRGVRDFIVATSAPDVPLAELIMGSVTANAHLIAAAPELLEALKEAVNLLEKSEPNWVQTHFRAVIKKAEGGAK